MISTSFDIIENGSNKTAPIDTASENVHNHVLILYTVTSSSSVL